MSIKSLSRYLLLLLTAVPVVSYAAPDDKIYAASECVVWSGPKISYNYSTIFNDTGRVIRVDCPAIHDNINGRIRAAYFTAKDRHTYRGVSCSVNTVYPKNVGGAGQIWGWFGPVISTGGWSDIWQTRGLGGNGATNKAHYYLSCSLPPKQAGRKSVLFNYRVNEI